MPYPLPVFSKPRARNVRTGPPVAFSSRSGFSSPSFERGFSDLGAGAVDLGAGSTFTRATTATTILSTRLIGSVASGSPRSAYSPAGVYLGYLPEDARTNVVLQSENFAATWVPVGTPTLVSASDSCGVVVLDTIGDDSAVVLEGYVQVVTFTGDGQKNVSFFVKAGSSTSTVVDLADTVAVAIRLRVVLDWSGGVPTPTMSVGTLLETQALGNSVYRIRCLTTAVTAANANSIQIYPATDVALTVTNTGTVKMGGVQATNSANPRSDSYIPTTTAAVTRNRDDLVYQLAGNISNTAGTMACEWLGVTGSGNGFRLIGDSFAGTPGMFDNGGNAVGIHDGTTSLATAAVGATNIVHKAAATWSGATMNAYLDGANKVSAAYDGSMQAVQIGIGMGISATLGTPMRNVRIWTRALSDAEVAAL